MLAADDVVDVFGPRPREVPVDVFNAGVVFSTGVTSFDGVDARESESLDAFSVSGFFGFDAGTTNQMNKQFFTHSFGHSKCKWFLHSFTTTYLSYS